MVSINPRKQENLKNDVSVVIPFYNSSETIGRAVASAVNQTYPVREIIIVDDGSEATHLESLREVALRNSQVRIIHLGRNMGPGSARNLGWNAAKSEWIAFLDSDDAWHPRKLEIQMEAVRRSRESVVMIGSQTMIVKEAQEASEKFETYHPSISNITTWQLLRRNRFSTPTVVLRKSLAARFSEGRRYSEDYELWLRVSSTGAAVIKVNLPLVYLYKEPYGVSGLSSHMIAMSLGEIKTLSLLRKDRMLTTAKFITGVSISLVKSFRRLILTYAKRVFR